ncbi:MAG TPA: alginate export family protein [Opitutaceae bacterium]|jgi:hypothetical protein
MRIHTIVLAFAAACAVARAQYTSPSPAGPAPGEIDLILKSAGQEFSGWDLGVNERVRYEDKSDAGTTHAGSNFDFDDRPPSTTSNEYWLSRLMPWAGYSTGWISVLVQGRSSYSWGDDRYTATAAGKNLPEDDGPFQLEKAYVALGDLKEFPLILTVGRQELAFGDQRLIGPSAWLNVPHAFDAAKLRYQDAFFGADVFSSHLVYTDKDHLERSDPHDTLSGIDFDFPGLSGQSVNEAYLFARNVSRDIVTDDWSQVPAPFRFTAPQDIYTLGVRSKSKPKAYGPWDYGLEGMWQFGDRTAVFAATALAAAKVAPRLSQEAWAFVAQGGYTWTTVPMHPRLAAIVSAASGDRNSADRDSETFQNLLPSNHGLYGIMDLSSLQNIEDYRLSLSVKPTTSTSLAVDVHQQYLETTHDYWYNVAGVPRNTAGATPGSGSGFNINPAYSPDLGQEADILGGWSVHKGFLLEAGLGHYFRGSYIKESFHAIGSRDAEYGYLQLTVNL